jgi:hypothetical protein
VRFIKLHPKVVILRNEKQKISRFNGLVCR